MELGERKCYTTINVVSVCLYVGFNYRYLANTSKVINGFKKLNILSHLDVVVVVECEHCILDVL